MGIIKKLQRHDVTMIAPHDVTNFQRDRITYQLSSKGMGIIEKIQRQNVTMIVPRDVTKFQRNPSPFTIWMAHARRLKLWV